MTSDRKKPGVAFWASVVLVAVLAYPLSIGPACWIASRPFESPGKGRIPTFYWPMVTYVPVAWYIKACVPAGSDVLVPFHDREGKLAWARYAAAAHGIDPGRL